MRSLALVAVLLLLVPATAAQTATPRGIQVIDERIGQVNEALASANETYGEREAFQAAQVELGRSGLALTKGATVVARSNLLNAYAALETGRTQAQAQGSEDPDQALVDRAQALAHRADANVSSLRSDLAHAPQAGLEPVALDGLLGVGHLVIQAMDLLDQHRTHQRTWDQGHHTAEVSRGLIGTAASAAMAADLAADLRAGTAQARAEAPVGQIVAPGTLAQVSQARVDWAKEQGPVPNQDGRDRFIGFHGNDEHLLALAAFTLWYQDVAFNRIDTQAQRGGDIEPLQVAQERFEAASGPIAAWHDELGTASHTGPGAMASAGFTLERTPQDGGRQANRSAAYAASLVARGVEHTAVLTEAFTGEAHVPGQPLPMPGASAEADEANQAPLPVLLGVGALIGTAALAGSRRRPR